MGDVESLLKKPQSLQTYEIWKSACSPPICFVSFSMRFSHILNTKIILRR
jgi:hypothetical protein